MSKIIQILQAGITSRYIFGLDDEGVVWELSDSQYGLQWNRKIGSPHNPNVSNPTPAEAENE